MHDIKIPDPSVKKNVFEVTQVKLEEAKAPDPSEKVKVRFEKFVQLVATHNFEEVMKRHAQEDVILSTNLLTDLANAHDEEPGSDKKLPIILIVGIIIGIAIAYFVIRF
ncbi:MAG: hypothetical protein AAB588_03095 [Patescibacteria group bacterium]